jgi:DNA transformation protein
VRASDDALCRQVLGLLVGMDRVTSRPMFGGIGLYRGARLFGLVHRGALYLRADDVMRRELARRGTGPFRAYRGRAVTAYWELPPELVADKRRVRAWARRAITASDDAARRTPSRPGGPRGAPVVARRTPRGPRRPLGPRR